MNFNEYWNEQPVISDKHGPETQKMVRVAAARAWNVARKEERKRCSFAVQAVNEDMNQVPEAIFSQMSADQGEFNAGVQVIIQLTKQSAVDAIQSAMEFAPADEVAKKINGEIQ